MKTLGWIFLAMIPGLIAFPMFKGPADLNSKFPSGEWFKDVLIYAGRALLFSLVWPLILLLIGIERVSRFIQKPSKSKVAVNHMKAMIEGKDKHLNEGKLLFSIMGGKGQFYCNECSYSQELVSFLHGISWSSSGYQCQNCGKFHTIEKAPDTTAELVCDCGGRLSRNQPLFCPVCKSFKVWYDITLIT